MSNVQTLLSRRLASKFWNISSTHERLATGSSKQTVQRVGYCKLAFFETGLPPTVRLWLPAILVSPLGKTVFRPVGRWTLKKLPM